MLETQNPNRLYMERLWARYESLKKEGLSLDMTRGKPCNAQLDLSNAMHGISETHSKDGIDCRNYGHPDGIPEARTLCARYLGTDPKRTLVLGQSSLEVMEEVIVQHLLRGGWPAKRKFICPGPGYDRHFKILEFYGIGMILVPMTENGPDIDAVREAVKDPEVVGIWCMPLYSNPTGYSYSAHVVNALANLKPACGRFILMWDNAYAHHHLDGLTRAAPDIMQFSRNAKTEDRVWIFGSFSKVTVAGAGLAILSASPKSLEWFQKSQAVRTIGPDKMNQLRHVKFLKTMTGVRALMNRHRRIIRPKFKAVLQTLEKEIGAKGVADWTNPDGGYFILLKMKLGSAKRVVELAKSVGVQLTPAGAPFPYGNDPEDAYIRIAPTFPDIKDVRRATRVLALCAEIAHREAHPQTTKR